MVNTLFSLTILTSKKLKHYSFLYVNFILYVHQETFEQLSLNLTQKEQKYHYLKISTQEEKHYNFLINLEKKIHEPVKLFKLDNTDKKTYGKRCPDCSHFGILYGLVEVHIQLINCSTFRPILSAIGTPTYKLAKFLVPILKPLTTNDYTFKTRFNFHEILLTKIPISS